MHQLEDSERQLQQRAGQVASEIEGLARKADETVGYGPEWEEAIGRFHAEGWMSMNVPSKFGGGGASIMDLTLVQEQVARVDGGLANCISHEACAAVAVGNANPELSADLFQRMIDGSLTCIAITEPQGGSDLGAMKTKAVRDGDDYVINGEKAIASLAGVAGIFLIWAKTGDEPGTRNISTFVAYGDQAGIEVGPPADTLGFRQLPHHPVKFDNLRVPAHRRVGEEGEGLKLFAAALNVGRQGGGAQALGLAAGSYEKAYAFAASRQAFGKPLTGHQGIQFKLADMYTSIEAGRALAYAAARAMDASDDLASREMGLYAAMVKGYESDMAMRVTEEAVQVFGAQGIWREHDVERLFRDAKVTQLVDGPNELMKLRIAHLLTRIHES
jgi:alkylation response protein AidB-like acyl-CoA dehydrogenase